MTDSTKKPDAEVKKGEPEEEKLAEGTLVSHLIELRQRLVKAVLAILLVFLALLPFTDEIFNFVAEPLKEQLPEGSTLITTGITAPFMVPFKATFFVALFLAMPIVLYQVWRFVAPGLYRKEKRFTIPLLVSSIVLFYAGIAFAYFIIFRIVFAFFIGVTPESVTNMPDIGQYLTFVLTLCFAFGIAFEVPVATVILIWSGLVTVKSLKAARSYVFIGAFVVGMFLTPPDVFSQTLLALPMYFLYEGGIIMAQYLIPERIAAQQAAEDTSD
jgi:sec-independent protein translocase protein TatC